VSLSETFATYQPYVFTRTLSLSEGRAGIAWELSEIRCSSPHEIKCLSLLSHIFPLLLPFCCPSFSKTLVSTCKSTRRQKPEDRHRQHHCRENLRSHNLTFVTPHYSRVLLTEMQILTWLLDPTPFQNADINMTVGSHCLPWCSYQHGRWIPQPSEISRRHDEVTATPTLKQRDRGLNSGPRSWLSYLLRVFPRSL
jgi:hypothetical protein